MNLQGEKRAAGTKNHDFVLPKWDFRMDQKKPILASKRIKTT